MQNSISLSGADIGALERRAVLSALRSDRLALGPCAREFERLVADYVGVRFAVAVSSGTAGLHLVVRALGLGDNDEVITTPFSFIASANCLLYERARPLFVDIDPDTLCLDPARVEAAITDRTRAILGVDVFGHPADWPALAAIARRHRLTLIEDSCEALGAGLRPPQELRSAPPATGTALRAARHSPARPADGPLATRRCGSFADAAVFAFYPNKQLTTGEGGIVVTDSARIANACRSMSNQGRRLAGGSWLEHIRLGFNYRLDELSAALGVAQLRRIDELLAERQRVAGEYSRLLAGVEDVYSPYCAPGASISWFVYVVRLAPRFSRADRDSILGRLRRRGVECADYFRPIHLQPFYRRRFGYRRGAFPVTEATSDRTIALPFHTRLTAAEIRRVVEELKQALFLAANSNRLPRRSS
jgi:perosamine synthetase